MPSLPSPEREPVRLAQLQEGAKIFFRS